MASRERHSLNADILHLPPRPSQDYPRQWAGGILGIDEISSIKLQIATDSDAQRTTAIVEAQEPPEDISKKQPPHTTATENDNLYATRCPVPGSRRRKQIYPLVPVSLQRYTAERYRARFEFVQEQLYQAMRDNKHLHHLASSIVFELHMVGTSPQTATPSIVILCESSNVRPLRALFKEKAREKLYCGRKSRVFQLFRKDPPLPPKPPFDLVYYRCDKAPVTQKAALQQIKASMGSTNSLCGVPVYYQDAQANIGITLKVGERVLSTTVAHLFGSTYMEDQCSETDDDAISLCSLESDQRTIADDDLVSLHPLWNDDADDDDIDGCEASCHFLSSVIIGDVPKPVPDTASGATSGQRIHGSTSLPGSAPFLDFALLHLDNSIQKNGPANSFFLDGPKSSRLALSGIVESPIYHGTTVYIISSNHAPKTGRLLSNYAYIGCGARQDMCRAWTLVVDGKEGIVEGECGSVVVDQMDNSVYGHIIGTNPMGHAYVVPFADVVAQIKIMFDTSKVSMLHELQIPPSQAQRRFEEEPQDTHWDPPPPALKKERTLPRSRCNEAQDFAFSNLWKNRQKADTGLSSTQTTTGVAPANLKVLDSISLDFLGSSNAQRSTLSASDYWTHQQRMLGRPGHMSSGYASPAVKPRDSFRSYIEKHSIQVPLTDLDSISQYFLPQSALQDYWTVDRIKEHMDKRTRVFSKLMTDGGYEKIMLRCQRIFSILVLIGKPCLVNRFLMRGISDSALPFAKPNVLTEDNKEPTAKFGGIEPPKMVLTSSSFDPNGLFGDDSTWKDFYREQWRFCAFVLKPGLVDTKLPDDCILPIVQRSPLRQCSTATTYKVEIHPEYNNLSGNKLKRNRPTHDTFVLKTFASQNESHYRNEVEAYKNLSMSGGAEDMMIKFYGSFEHKGSYNVLLEYAPSLAEWFRETNPPVKETDIQTFWSKFLSLETALKRIHALVEELPPQAVNIPPTFQNSNIIRGVHQDIRPENILVSGGPKTSQNNVTFKLGDLGLSNALCSVRSDSEGDMSSSSSKRLRQGGKTENDMVSRGPRARYLAVPYFRRPDHPGLHGFNGRDSMFLVDDSSTMSPHWHEAKLTLQALAYLAKNSDLDGLDLHFMSCSQSGRDYMEKFIHLDDLGRQPDEFNECLKEMELRLIAKGDATSLEIFRMVKSFLDGEMSIWEWFLLQRNMVEDLERKLVENKRRKPRDFALKRTSDQRLVEGFFKQHFDRNPVVDPCGSHTEVPRSIVLKRILRRVLGRWLEKRDVE
ncbi:hypothetical protein BCR34DRAFT_600134 [Clohesyomyces aquaticus]|uniref:Protein kinase domain-containing protein n=1 Tax=Clohesyomyces aquaticus TaxID=1231657 RepID=A0A1Y1ZSM9_9PLEO|nr:hypothetical protein BCR34DRAFT_600134 [Clohesyomyces aquaticus]